MSLEAEDCALIILASGLSERFGSENKLLADLGGKPVIAHVMETARHVGFEKVFVVAPRYDSLINIIQSYGFHWIENATPEHGQGASLALGAKAVLDRAFSNACILLGDMPFVKFNHINSLLERYDLNEPVFSCHNDILIPPAIFNYEALRQVASLTGDAGGKNKVIGRLEHALPLSDLAVRDMDTPQDLEEMRALLKTI